MERETALAELVALTEVTEDEALQLLEAADWNLESAAQLFFEQGSTAPGTSLDDASRAIAEQLARENDSGSVPRARDVETFTNENNVRQPDATRTERLYDFEHAADYQRARPRPVVQELPFASFRDGGSQGLEMIYQPPDDILSPGSLDELKGRAERRDQWMLINVQDPAVFQSLQLNADLWTDSVIKDIVRGTFQFAQRTLPTTDATRLQQMYQLHVLPAIIVVDPNTGQKMHEWLGKIDKDRFMEELLPFTETLPSDPAAGSLVSSTVRQAAFDAKPQAIGAAGVVGVSVEDESLNHAIAASLLDRAADDVTEGNAGNFAVGGTRPGNAARGCVEASISGSVPVAEPSSAARNQANAGMFWPARKAEAQERLGSEPAPATDVGRVAIQLPHGRVTRRFRMSDPVQSLYDFTATELSDTEAARPFVLVLAGPGGTALGDTEQSLGAAGIVGSVVRLQW